MVNKASLVQNNCPDLTYQRLKPSVKSTPKPKGFTIGFDHRALAVEKAKAKIESDDPDVVSDGIHLTIQMEKANIAVEELRMKKVALANEVALSSQAMTPEEIALQVREMRAELGLDIKEIEYGDDRTIDAVGRSFGGVDEGADEGAVVARSDIDGRGAEEGVCEANGSGGDFGSVSSDVVEP